MLEQSRLRDYEARCTQESAPRCRLSCPLDMDVRGFLAAMAASRPAEARKLIERHLPLPGVLCAVCDHPCEDSCLRRDLGGALSISELERVCLASVSPQTRILPRPAKKQRLAVLGAGLAGLTAAFDLGRKGFPVTVFDTDRSSALLSSFPCLPADAVGREWQDMEKNRVSFQNSDEAVFYSEDAARAFLATLEQDFDAVFADLSRLPLSLEAEALDPLTLHWQGKVCAGGHLDTTPTGALYASASRQAGEGRRAGITLQRIMGGVSLDAERDDDRQSRLHVDLKNVPSVPRVLPAAEAWTPEEAAAEASRCLQCSCMQCVKECVYLQKYKEFPRLYARRLFSNATVVKGTRTTANVVMNGCAMCGQCEVICPEHFSMADLCLEVRRDAVSRDVMPDSAHAFALEDMEQACGPDSAFLLEDSSLPDGTHAPRLFFPGCQLAGSRPRQVLAMYEWLKSALPGGLSLYSTCCGIPAHWAGREAIFEEHSAELCRQWEACGRPEIIVACSSCKSTLRLALPTARIVSLWEMLDELMPEVPSFEAMPSRFTVQDPCGARHDSAWQKAVRSLASKAGAELVEPVRTREATACCGYGGLVWNAQPELADDMTGKRAQDFDGPVLTSCIMCRDRFAATLENEGESWHLFDILPQTAGLAPEKGDPGLSSRRAGRAALRREALGAEGEVGEAGGTFSLRISDDVLASLERQFILRQDALEAVQGIEATGMKFRDRETGHFLGSWRPRRVTFWVEYRADEDGGFTLLRAWCHRMVVPGAIQPSTEIVMEKRIRA